MYLARLCGTRKELTNALKFLTGLIDEDDEVRIASYAEENCCPFKVNE